MHAFLIAAVLSQTIYVYTDAKGVSHYSDNPSTFPKGAKYSTTDGEEISVLSMPAPPVPPPAPEPPPAPPAPTVVYVEREPTPPPETPPTYWTPYYWGGTGTYRNGYGGGFRQPGLTPPPRAPKPSEPAPAPKPPPAPAPRKGTSGGAAKGS